MNPIQLERTDTTPEVCLDHVNRVFYIRGESRPENTRKFYEPILTWLDSYNGILYFVSDQNKNAAELDLTFEFYFEYLNSSSIKFLFDILMKIDALKSNAANIKILWKYDEGDEDMKDNGEELKDMINLPFEMMMVPRQE